jgi:kinesin family protein 13
MFHLFSLQASNFIGQKRVFEAVGLDILAKAWSGYNSCLFAYGQTGSGKVSENSSLRTSHIVQYKALITLPFSSVLCLANVFASQQSSLFQSYSVMGYNMDKGVIPRICESLFYFIERSPDPANFKVDACYLEVQREQINKPLVITCRECAAVSFFRAFVKS